MTGSWETTYLQSHAALAIGINSWYPALHRCVWCHPQMQWPKSKPRYLGANSTSVTLVRESTSVVRLTQRRVGAFVVDTFSPMTSSQTDAVRSKEQVAITWPNSGFAHETRHMEPECAFQLLVTDHLPCSSSSHIWNVWQIYFYCILAGGSKFYLPLQSDRWSRLPCADHNSQILRRVLHLCGPQWLALHRTCLFSFIYCGKQQQKRGFLQQMLPNVVVDCKRNQLVVSKPGWQCP